MHSAKKYYVCFVGKEKNEHHWWHHITGEEFSHCFLFFQLNDTSTLVIDPRADAIVPNQWDLTIKDSVEFIKLKYLQAKILSFEVEYPERALRNWRGIYSCVTILKGILNLRKFWIVTPKQLYAELIQNGAVTI